MEKIDSNIGDPDSMQGTIIRTIIRVIVPCSMQTTCLVANYSRDYDPGWVILTKISLSPAFKILSINSTVAEKRRKPRFIFSL